MPIVQSFGTLQAVTGDSPLWSALGSPTSVSLYGQSQTYAAIYSTQPNVRTCIDFLARNCGQLGLHTFRRLSSTDRERLTDHQLARWLSEPNPNTTPYRLVESLVADLALYFNAYWLKVRDVFDDGSERIGLVRLPPEQMTVDGVLLPTGYQWTIGGRTRPLPLSEVVYFNGYNPNNPIMGLSPLETLRRVLAEEAAAGAHRESYWRNAGRHEGIIEQAADGPKWDATQKAAFREQWQEFTAGGKRAGQTPVLPKGMTYKTNSYSARDSEYLSARKLSREECAAAFHIPLPLVGILEHATFSNIREQHKHLYQDCLGPWLQMIEQEVERQVLPECTDHVHVYVEFNIAEKLKGSFEEQSASLLQSTGRPIMTANEGRARLNLPSITDDPSADQLAAQQGGPAANVKSGYYAAPGETTAADLSPLLRATWARQRVRLARLPEPERAAAFDVARWAKELGDDLSRALPDRPRAALDAVALQVTTDTRLILDAGGDPFTREASLYVL